MSPRNELAARLARRRRKEEVLDEWRDMAAPLDFLPCLMLGLLRRPGTPEGEAEALIFNEPGAPPEAAAFLLEKMLAAIREKGLFVTGDPAAPEG